MTSTEAPGTVVVLAAGRGTRLGGDVPKPLTPVGDDGETILARQLRLLRPLRDAGWRTSVVVGHQRELLTAALGPTPVVHNPRYAETNTSKSLLLALREAPGRVLWLNGDVVFSPSFADAVCRAMTGRRARSNAVGVCFGPTAEEEVRFRLDERGQICELSKQVVGGLGEAIGVNHVTAASRPALAEALERCEDQDYFERGIERCIEQGGAWRPLDLSAHFAVEVDFPDDLERALTHTRARVPATV